MGYQSSRIIWGKEKKDPNDHGYNLLPVTDWDQDIIYTSGNLVIYRDPLTKIGLFQCMIEEICGVRPNDYDDSKWKRISGVEFIETSVIYLPDSHAEKVLNSKRTAWKPGAKLIKFDKNGDDSVAHLYECDRATNFYQDGFDYSKWHLVKQNIGIAYIPRDHKEVYYDDGKNKKKFHIAMYYIPDDDFTYEDEIKNFSENTSYSKGELCIYKNKEIEDDYNTIYRYIYHIPSTPSRVNMYGEIEYTQPTPLNNTWERADEISFFDKTKAYKKDDQVLWNQYNEQYNDDDEEETEFNDGRGWMYVPISIFRDDYTYKRGDRCLHRIKPDTVGDVTEKDIDALVTTGDYEWITDQYIPSLRKPNPCSEYGELIEAREEIYGLYRYNKDKKPRGYGFTNEDWILIPEVKMYKYDINRTANLKYYSAGDGTIDAYQGTYAYFLCQQVINSGRFYSSYDYSPDSLKYGFFHTIEKVQEQAYPYGKEINPSDSVNTNSLAAKYWNVVTQKIYDEATGRRVFKAVRDIPRNTEFSRENWTLVTQEKSGGPGLYGWIWRKYNFGSGGTPFGSDFAIQSTGSSHARVRFSSLSIYRGDNILELGNVSVNNSQRNRTNFQFTVVGNNAWYHSTDTVYAREQFRSSWYMFSVYNMLIESGATPLEAIATTLYFNDNYTITAVFTGPNQVGENVMNWWNLVLTDLKSKSYYVLKKSYEIIEPSDMHYNYLDGNDNSMICGGYKKYLYIPYAYDPDIFNTGSISGGWIFNAEMYADVTTLRNKKTGDIIGIVPEYSIVSDAGEVSEEHEEVRFMGEFTSDYDSLAYFANIDLNNKRSMFGDRKIVSRSYWYYVFEDGWTGDDKENTISSFNKWYTNFQSILQILGVEHVEGTWDDLPVSGWAYTHYYTSIRNLTLTFARPIEPFYQLFPQFNALYRDKYNFPVSYEGDYKWITTAPLTATATIWSQDGTTAYTLRALYGYFSKKLEEDMDPDTDVLFYCLVTLDIFNNGFKRTFPLIKNKHIGVNYYVPGKGYVTWTSVSEDIMPMVYNGGLIFNIIYKNEALDANGGGHIYIIQSGHNGTEIDRSAGLWKIPLYLYKYNESGQVVPATGSYTADYINYFREDLRMRNLYHLCHIEYIPYYGNQTCHLNGVNRDIKYLCINFGRFARLGEYYENKRAEYRENNCLYIDLNFFQHQNAPTTSVSSGSLVKSSSDMIINTQIPIFEIDDDYSTNSATYNICIVLPLFKILFPNAFHFLSANGKAYDPIMTGAFFWLTTDDITHMASPQYGGPEEGARGFEGW